MLIQEIDDPALLDHLDSIRGALHKETEAVHKMIEH